MTRKLRLADFDVDIARFVKSDVELDLFHFVHSTDAAMSQPIVPGEGHRYSITQLIADILRQRGYDGVVFRSSVGSGQNVCLFDPISALYVDKSAKVRRVEAIRYRLEEVETVLDKADADFAV